MSEFPYLFAPIQVGPVTISNRLFTPSHVTFFAENNLPSERHVYYYAERAKGGFGLINFEGVCVAPSGYPYAGIIKAWDDRVISGYRRVADAVHGHGATIFGQVTHKGRVMSYGTVYSRQPAVAPSPVGYPDVGIREIPKELEVEEILELISAFAKAARYMREGGFDGVEIHCTHGYLPQQFLSPLTNLRTDEYGGSPEKRLKFVLDLIEAIRKEVGDDYVVGMRLGADEFAEGGLTLDDTKEIAQRLAATGKLNYFNISTGAFNWDLIIPAMYMPLGALVYLAAGIREAVDIPVFAAIRINDPIQAERILADGHADMVGLVRAGICDPQFANKAKAGKLEEIRTCMACNVCIAQLTWGLPMRCAQNPAVGLEKEEGIDAFEKAKRPKRVMVVGGGPAGLKAAETAAERGHIVTLYEKNEELGGQVRLATKNPSREEIGQCVRYLVSHIGRLGVQVKTGVEVTPELITEQKPEAVVVATGSTSLRTGFYPLFLNVPQMPGANQDNVVSVEDVLEEKAQVGNNVLVIDEDGYYRGPVVAEFLADRGKKVQIITSMPTLAMGAGPTIDKSFIYRLLIKKGVVISPNLAAKEIAGNTVVVYDLTSLTDRRIEDIDTVVLITGNKVNDELYRSLKGMVDELYLIGDAASPRQIVYAINEGYQVGKRL